MIPVIPKPPKDARSGIVSENIDEILEASISPKHATLGNQQQYPTPVWLAELCNDLLPNTYPRTVLDPQCAGGNTFSGLYSASKFGFELDNRYQQTGDGIYRITANCVKAWAILEDIHPEVKFEMQNANPPFGLKWKLPEGGSCDSTEYTWRKIMEHAAVGGCGWFIANSKTIERLNIDKHDRVYMYQVLPVGVWDNCDVSVGIVHWRVGPGPQSAPYQEGKIDGTRMRLDWTTLDKSGVWESNEFQKVFIELRAWFNKNQVTSQATDRTDMENAMRDVAKVITEEKADRPPFNIWLDEAGKIKTYLSTRVKVKRKITREEVLRLAEVNDSHPLTLTTARETRKLLAELVSCGAYEISPQARTAIESALEEVKSLACPIMDITDFERVAYLDEEDFAECKSSGGLPFTPGKKYELRTDSYSFTEAYKRDKIHYSEKGDEQFSAKHDCVLTRKDRYVMFTADDGQKHRFMERPDKDCKTDHDESKLWEIFVKPHVNTIGDKYKDEVARNIKTLKSCELLAGFKYYPGQLEYLARFAVKDYGLSAASVGTGKTLMALSLIQIKGPYRALIIAPQGTIRGEEDEDDDSSSDYTASQWVSEIRKFCPGLPVFELFSFEDYERIIDANHGELPPGVYISYYEAMFQNKSREKCPEGWTNERLWKECNHIAYPKMEAKLPMFPEPPTDCGTKPLEYWGKTIGLESKGIRCLLQPTLATLIGDKFDMICLDEAHYFQTADSNRTEQMVRLQPRYRYAFTATPIPNVVTNLFSLMGWLCVPDWYKGDRLNAAWPYKRDDIKAFESTFLSEERDYTQEKMDDDRNRNNPTYRGGRARCIKVSPIISSPALLLKILKPTMAYISKPMCNVDYKAAKVTDVRVPMGKAQAALYKHFLNRGNVPHKNPLVRARLQSQYLRSVCTDPAGFNHHTEFSPRVGSNFNPKMVAMLELARDIVKRGEPLVIINARKGQTNMLYSKLIEAGVICSRIDSTIPAARHAYESNQFKKGKSQVMLMGIKCAVGHSFSECPNMIIGSIEYSPGPLEQAGGRIDRVNSKYQANIWCFLHQFSIEEVMFDLVGQKADSATICLMGKRVPRAFKPVMADEILALSIAKFQEGNSMDEKECESRWPELLASFKCHA